VLRRGERFSQFIYELRCAAFVGIDAENPVVFRRIEGEVAELAEAAEFLADDFGAELTGNFHRAIGAERIHDDDFIRPLHAFEHGTDLPGFVERERINGDRLCCRHAGGQLDMES